MSTLMWEVRAAEGRLDALLAWVGDHAPPEARVYRSADARVVVIADGVTALPEVPADLVARPPHAWRFEAVRR